MSVPFRNHKINEVKGLRGGLLQYAAQGIPKIDADIVKNRHFWMDTNYPVERMSREKMPSRFYTAGVHHFLHVFNVRPVNPELKITDVCIEENQKVIVEDFLTVVREGFDRNGIATRVVNSPADDECEYVLKYTAFNSWDVASYMHHAELTLERDGMVGSAKYHLVGQGGFSLTKWKSTKTKMDPIIDELLGNATP